MNSVQRNPRRMPSSAKKPTIIDVANLCGVTAATVSRVLNAKKNFSTTDAVRERILQTARTLGYVPNIAARNLVQGATHIIGIFASPRTHIAEGIKESLLDGIADKLHPAGYELFFEVSSRENSSSSLPYWRFDGAILLQMPRPETVAELDRRGVPYVCVNETLGKPHATVLADDAGGMKHAVEHLVQLGHKRIGYANARGDYFAHHSVGERYGTLLELARNHSLTTVNGHEASFQSGKTFLQQTVNVGGATAIITYDHHIAVMIVGAAHDLNLRIPEDFSLICFNDVFPVSQLGPPLTAIAVSGRTMGNVGAEMLLGRLSKSKSSPGKVIRVAEDLIVRRSTAPPKSRG